MSITRRQFLEHSVASGAMSALLPGCIGSLSTQTGNVIIGGGQYKDLDTNTIHYLISLNDLDNKVTERVELDFLLHGIHQRPDLLQRLAIFETKGRDDCKFDLKERRVIRKLAAAPRRHFYGHGCYSSDGSLLYCT